MIKLHGIPRSRAMRCLWMLEEIGVPYELVPTSFTGDARQPAYLALNPNGRIPTLVDGDTVLWESMAINLYLADKYDGGLRPASLEERAHAVKWSFWVMTETERLLLDVMSHRLILPEADRRAEVAHAAEEALARPFGVLDGALAGREHLIGNAFGVADLNVASVLVWARMSRLDLSKYPNVGRWLEASLARPAFKRATAPRT